MHVVQWVFIAAGAILQLLVIRRLTLGSYRVFPALFAYAIACFLATSVEVAATLDLMGWSRYTSKYYWINDIILQALVVALVLSLVHRSLQMDPRRHTIMRLLGLGALGLGAGSYFLNWSHPLDEGMTNVARNLSFGAVMLNLVLWMTLIGNRPSDPRLLMISGALGIQMAGQAIGHSLRQLAMPRRSIPLVIAGNIVIAASHVTCLYLWWRVLRRHEDRAARQRQIPPQS